MGGTRNVRNTYLSHDHKTLDGPVANPNESYSSLPCLVGIARPALLDLGTSTKLRDDVELRLGTRRVWGFQNSGPLFLDVRVLNVLHYGIHVPEFFGSSHIFTRVSSPKR